MKLDSEPLSIEAVLEEFAEDLDGADQFASEFGARTPLQDLPSFESLTGYEREMMGALAQHYGIDLANPHVVQEHSIEGTPDSPGEGRIKVRLIATNNPQVFRRIHLY